MRKAPVTIFGDGIAGLSAARMFCDMGVCVSIAATSPPSPRRVALNEASLFLLDRIWGADLVRTASHHVLERRILVWGTEEPLVLDDRAAVVGTDALIAAMTRAANGNARLARSVGQAAGDCDIVAAGMAPHDRILSGGARMAVQADAILAKSADRHAMLVEAVEQGWLIVLPVGESKATVMGVTAGNAPCLKRLLAQSRYARLAVAEIAEPSRPSSAAPCLYVPPCDPAAMHVGGSALRLDPISGDGIASALRSAHLAVLLFMEGLNAPDGGFPDTLYQRRLARAMRAHLGGIARLYGTAPLAGAWQDELASIAAMDIAIAKIWPDSPPTHAIMDKSLVAL